MNDFEIYFRENKGRLIDKWIHYFEIYDRHFSRFRNKEVNILEIGVSQGGSLQMWQHYFGTKTKVYGIDILKQCRKFENSRVKIFTGSQSDRHFLREVCEKVPPLDIIMQGGFGIVNYLTYKA